MTRSRVERRLYLAEPAALLAVIGAQDDAVESLLVVGHNPGLTELVHELLPGFDVDDLPTGAVVALDYPAGTAWAGLETAAGRLTYYDFPKNPREPAHGSLSGPRWRARSMSRRVRLSGFPAVGGR